MRTMVKVGLIGKDGRTSAMEASCKKSPRVKETCVLSTGKFEALGELLAEVLSAAKRHRPDFVVVGPEEPLAVGIVDALHEELGIPCVGPSKALAILEASKAFARDLVREYEIPGNPQYQVFKELDGIETYIRSMQNGYVIKPDGLTGGKGVRVSDSHLFSVEEAVDYCDEILTSGGGPVVVEEKLDGEEFSLMSFCDGLNLKHMVPVQDHKRVGHGDTGPNTGGMGSYSCADHGLPFLPPSAVREAEEINRLVANALLKETGLPYRGILYGGFMLTAQGVKLIEYNVRFGDPEALNVLSILKTDFVDICEGIIEGTLDEVDVEFAKLATVCKYLVPAGYPDAQTKNAEVHLAAVMSAEKAAIDSGQLSIYKAAVEPRPSGNVMLTGSRAIAIVGVAATLQEAECIAERAAARFDPNVVYHRTDIGTDQLVARRIEHVKALGLIENASA